MIEPQYREKPPVDKLPENHSSKTLWSEVRAQFIGKKFGESQEKSLRAQQMEHWSKRFDITIPYEALTPEATHIVAMYEKDLEQVAQKCTEEQIAVVRLQVAQIVEQFASKYIHTEQRPPLIEVQRELSSGRLFTMFNNFSPEMRKMAASWVGILLILFSVGLGVMGGPKTALAATDEQAGRAMQMSDTNELQSPVEQTRKIVAVIIKIDAAALYKSDQDGTADGTILFKGIELKATGTQSADGQWIEVIRDDGEVRWIKATSVDPIYEQIPQARGTATIKIDGAVLYRSPNDSTFDGTLLFKGTELKTTGNTSADGQWVEVIRDDGEVRWIKALSVNVVNSEIVVKPTPTPIPPPEITEEPPLEVESPRKIQKITIKLAMASLYDRPVSNTNRGLWPEGTELIPTGYISADGEFVQVVNPYGHIQWIKTKSVDIVYEGDQLPTPEPPPPSPTPIPTFEPVPPDRSTEFPVEAQKTIFFTTSQEADAYLRDLERLAGFDRNTMSTEMLNTRRREISTPRERTIRFIVGKHFWEQLVAKGGNPEEFLSNHVRVLNEIYAKAGIPIHYKQNATLVIPWITDHKAIVHQPDGVVINDNNEKIHYSYTDDTTWVLSETCNDEQYPNYADKVSILLKDIGVDPGLIHEVIHHTGMYDLYHGLGYFSDMSYLESVFPYTTDAMNNHSKMQLTPASILGIQKLMNNGLFGPQHNGDAVAFVDNFGEQNHINAALANEYLVNFNDANGVSLTGSILGLYFPTGGQVHEVRSDRSPDKLNYFKTITGERFFIDNESVILTKDKLVQTQYAILKFGSLSLPIERYHFIYSNLYQNEKQDKVEINIRIFVDPNNYHGDGNMFIDMITVPQGGAIPYENNGRRVIAASRIPNTDVYTIWSMNEHTN